ncbi:hypothetical protein LXA20_17655, partial [Erwinia amylovora]|nr:hypothetical protein [Erwinia amylovora]
RMTVSLYLSAPDLLQRDSPAYWAFTAGVVVVLISAVLVLVLGIYPQPLISMVNLAQPLHLYKRSICHYANRAPRSQIFFAFLH